MPLHRSLSILQVSTAVGIGSRMIYIVNIVVVYDDARSPLEESGRSPRIYWNVKQW